MIFIAQIAHRTLHKKHKAHKADTPHNHTQHTTQTTQLSPVQPPLCQFLALLAAESRVHESLSLWGLSTLDDVVLATPIDPSGGLLHQNVEVQWPLLGEECHS